MFHETLRDTLEPKKFISRCEVVGWTQSRYATSHPINALVVGRELGGVVTKDNGEIKFEVWTYVYPMGNECAFKLLPNAHPHDGYRGKEFIIKDQYSPSFAMKLEYSSHAISEEENFGVELTVNKPQEVLLTI